MFKPGGLSASPEEILSFIGLVFCEDKQVGSIITGAEFENENWFLLCQSSQLGKMQKTVIKSLADSPDVSVVVFACSGFVLDRYGHAVDEIEEFTPSVKIKILHNNVEGETPSLNRSALAF